MFCTHCGAKVPDGANFCVGCGTPGVAACSPAPPATASRPPAAPYAAGPAAGSDSRCVAASRSAARMPVVRFAVVSGRVELSPLRRGASTPNNWSRDPDGLQLPGRKDMAKLQFGNSSCQIEGVYVPVADMNLSPRGQRLFHASRAAVERPAGQRHHDVADKGHGSACSRACR